MSAAYSRHAYARAIFAELQRYLVDRFMATTDAPPRAQILCEEVFYADREVPQDALHDVLELLQRLENAERQQMQEYRMERRAPLPNLRDQEPTRGRQEKRKRSAGSPRSGEDSGTGGDAD